jgi:xylan 1,4-beta-xylosidase
MTTAASAATTPIVPGFYPDPTICRVGDEYYLAHSSFEYFPGVPIWHSRDLLRWTQIGHVLTRGSQLTGLERRGSSGLWAGTLRHHDGRFWYVTTNTSDFDAGQFLVWAEDPAGPWSDPVHVPEAYGIDPDIAWADGHCYLTWNAWPSARGEGGIAQARLDVKTGLLLEPAYLIWQGSGLGTPEGPHLYEVDGTWYLLLADGGTERGHLTSVARGSHPSGPFEECPANPILTHRSSTHPVQNVGHADLVRTPSGGWAAVYLGVRPGGLSPKFHVLGRETFLAGVDWMDGWPVFDENHFEVPPAATGFVDTFDPPVLGLRWVVPGGEPSTIVELDSAGGLRVLPVAGDPDDPASADLLCCRVRDLRWLAEATLEGPGRFLLRIDERHAYGLTRNEDRVAATARIGDLDVILDAIPVPAGPATLRIESVAPRSTSLPLAGPDDIVLSLARPESSHELARLDGRYLSTEVATGFTGRMLALGALTVPAQVRSVTYQPLNDDEGDA